MSASECLSTKWLEYARFYYCRRRVRALPDVASHAHPLVPSRFLSVILIKYDVQGFDVKSLRAFRVIRPLKLVNGVPSNDRWD